MTHLQHDVDMVWQCAHPPRRSWDPVFGIYAVLNTVLFHSVNTHLHAFPRLLTSESLL